MLLRILILAIATLMIMSCGVEENSDGKWLKGSQKEKVEMIEKQFRGTDVAMIEISYRYKELYTAGLNGNWEYATHELEHLEEALENAMIRRPDRKKSADIFTSNAIPALRSAIESKDSIRYFQSYELMRVSCNNCHKMEEHEYIEIITPTNHFSVVK